MQVMLGTLLDRLQGFLGKAYFLAGFLPMVVFLTLNALLAAAVFPDAAARLQELTRLDAGNLLTWLGLLLLAYVLGLLVWSLNPTIRRFLEGGHLPRWVRRHLVRLHERELIALLGQRRQLIVALFDLRQVTQGPDRWAAQLVAARRKGKERPAKDVSSELKVASRELQRRRDRLEVLGLADLRPLFELLKDELAANPADQVRELDQMQVDFVELLEFVHQSAEAAYTELNSELGIRFPKNVARVGPTRLANQAEVQREYGLRRYGLDIELYWLRLQKIARGDDRFFPLLEDAKTQLDFLGDHGRPADPANGRLGPPEPAVCQYGEPVPGPGRARSSQHLAVLARGEPVLPGVLRGGAQRGRPVPLRPAAGPAPPAAARLGEGETALGRPHEADSRRSRPGARLPPPAGQR